MLPREAPDISGVVESLISAARGHKYRETTTTTITRDGDVVEETTVVHDRYCPPDPQTAKIMFEIGFQALKGLQ